MKDAPWIAVIAVALVLVLRPWISRHRRRHIKITIDVIEGAQKPPALPPKQQDEGLDEG